MHDLLRQRQIVRLGGAVASVTRHAVGAGCLVCGGSAARYPRWRRADIQDDRPTNACRPLILICALIAIAGPAGVLLVAIDPAGADINTRIDVSANRAESLRAAVHAQTRRMKSSASALATARRWLGDLQADNARHQARLNVIRSELLRTRDRLTRLVSRQRSATAALRVTLDAAYRSGRPDLVSVIMNSNGFADLLERVDFLKRVSNQNARIMNTARVSRRAVAAQARSLAEVQARQQRVARTLQHRTDEAQVLETALLQTQQSRLNRRARTSAALRDIQSQLAKLRRRLASRARAGIPLNPGGVAQAPAGAPSQVALVIAAGNAIAGLPYLYGGGHAGFKDTAYDCSGSISYALAAAGLVTSPMASGGFMSWGESGPGKWITIYTNPGHMFMVVGGWRFDTTALRSGGTRWTRDMRSTAGFLARHPPGL